MYFGPTRARVRRTGGRLHSYRGRRILSIEEGWKEQQSGTNYINGTIGTNLLKDGEVITVQQEFCPAEEFLEQEWPDESRTSKGA